MKKGNTMGVTTDVTDETLGPSSLGYSRFYSRHESMATSKMARESSSHLLLLPTPIPSDTTTTAYPSATTTTAAPSVTEAPPRPKSAPPSVPKPVPPKQIKPPAPKKPEPEEPATTIRVDRAKILLNIGNKRKKMEEDKKVFDAAQMRAKEYKEWRKQAKALLPSQTGGPVIEKVADAIDIVPLIKKEKDPKAVHEIIRRTSLGAGEPPKVVEKKKSVKVDFTQARPVILPPRKSIQKSVHSSSSSSYTSSSTSSSSSSTDSSVVITMTAEEQDFFDFAGEFDEDEVLAEYERHKAGTDFRDKIKTLKGMTDHLANKRAVRQQMVEKATGQTVLDAEEIPIREHFLFMIESIGDIFHDIFEFFQIWEKQIKEINGKYGVVTANYFVWVRQMLALELFDFFLVLVIIIIPQMVQQSFWGEYTTKTRQFAVTDLIHGEGSMHESYMYYTGYHAKNEESPYPFTNPAFRFVFCILLKFIILTYFIFSRITQYYQRARMQSKVSGVAHMDTFKAIMFAWDYSCRDEQSKVFLHQTIAREMQVLVMKATKGTTKVEVDLKTKRMLAFAVKHFGLFWGKWAIHILGNVLIIVSCGMMAVLLQYLCELKQYYYINCVPTRDDHTEHRDLNEPVLCPNGDESLYLWVLSVPNLFTALATLVLTKLILHVGDMESWSSPEWKIYATMTRAGCFYFINLSVFYTFWLKAKPKLHEEGFVAEAIFGKELYRLVVTQGLIELTFNLLPQVIYYWIRKKMDSDYKPSEFRTEYYCLSMFYMFSMSRISMLYCPPLGIFVMLRLVYEFYQNKFILYKLSSREKYNAHVSQVYGPFLFSFFILCYLITSFMNLYYLSDTIPSKYDGPFQRYSVSYDEVLGKLLEKGDRTKWISHLAEPGFLIVIIACLLALLYFCRAWAKIYEPIMEHLHELITFERADRDLLLKAIYQIGQVTEDNDKAAAMRAKMEYRMRQIKVKNSDEDSESDEIEDEHEDDDDHDDHHISALIRHVQRRKSVGIEAGRIAVGDGINQEKRVAGKSALHDSHTAKTEEIVATIVQKRARKSLEPQANNLNLGKKMSEESI